MCDITNTLYHQLLCDITNTVYHQLDEPTGNLDTKTSKEIMGLLEDIHNLGNTIIVVTHEEDIAEHAERIIRLRDGEIVVDEKNKNRRMVNNKVEVN